MPHIDPTAQAIQQMVKFFLPHCVEQSTLRELDSMVSDDERWRHTHALFGRIRAKLLCTSAEDQRLRHQYSFEEICAKTLFNMSGHIPRDGFPYPFDEDSPFWVVPIAIQFARALGVSDPLEAFPFLRSTDVQPQ